MSILKHRNQKGFTLVELLVVIAIIGILATLLLLQLGIARQKGRDAKRVTDISQTRTAIELYFDDNATYPQQATYVGLAGLLAPKYLTILPADPTNTGNYTYNYAYTGATKYQVWAELETAATALKSDADIDSTGWTGQVVTGATDTACVAATAKDCVYDMGQN